MCGTQKNTTVINILAPTNHWRTNTDTKNTPQNRLTSHARSPSICLRDRKRTRSDYFLVAGGGSRVLFICSQSPSTHLISFGARNELVRVLNGFSEGGDTGEHTAGFAVRNDDYKTRRWGRRVRWVDAIRCEWEFGSTVFGLLLRHLMGNLWPKIYFIPKKWAREFLRVWQFDWVSVSVREMRVLKALTHTHTIRALV